MTIKSHTMSFRLFTILGLMTTSAILFSCTNSVKGTADTNNSLEVLTSFQTPIIRGAGTLKGMRIGVKALVAEQSILDSILYEGLTTEASILKTTNDTVWLEAYFYPNQFLENRTENTIEFSSKKCTLFYHDKSQNKNVVISDLKMVTDQTMWK